jgi:hypothetical protein
MLFLNSTVQQCHGFQARLLDDRKYETSVPAGDRLKAGKACGVKRTHVVLFSLIGLSGVATSCPDTVRSASQRLAVH